jgi:hypothetical protein
VPDAALRRLALAPNVAGFLAIKGWEDLGFARLGDYARERLGFAGRALQSFAFVASRLPGLPLVAAASCAG